MAKLKNTIFNKNIAEDTSNILLPDTGAVANGIGFKSNINSNSLNGYLNLLSENVQYLQFAGGLYSNEGDYHEGNIASLVIKKGNDYSINQFRRNSNNSKVLNNNPPIKDANILAVNGIDVYEGGTFNDDWDKMSAEYSIEAIANTVMGRDNEGASNVKMPADVHDDTVINNKYLNEQIAASNLEIDKKLETSRTEINKELEKKQNKLTAGKNIEISEDNVISAAGDLSTKAANVTYDNSKTNLEYISGYDFPKFKTPIADTINLVITNADRSQEYPAAIKKQEDGSYRLNSSIDNYNVADSSLHILLYIKSIEGNSNSYQMYSAISQFFEFQNQDNIIFYNLEKEECNISNIDANFKFVIASSSLIGILVVKQDETEFKQGNYNIRLNIKNRVLRNQDTNLFVNNSSNLYTLSFINDNGNMKLTGQITANGRNTTAELVGFYSPIIENYFNLSSILVNTVGITSSSGKALKFCVVKSDTLNDNLALYMFSIAYQDESNIQEGDVFTFNLTPDKNAELEAVKGGVDNVQVLGEALNEKIDKEIEIIIDENIPDIYDYSGKETLTNKKYIFPDGTEKPIYRKCLQKQYDFILDSAFHEVNAFQDFNLVFTRSTVEVGTTADNYWDTFLGAWASKDDFVRSFHLLGRVGFQYQLTASEIKFKYYRIITEYYKRG